MNKKLTPFNALLILREARKRIANDDDRYICIAIKNAAGYLRLSYHTERLRDKVMKTLHDKVTFEHYYGVTFSQYDQRERMRKLRLRYLDNWIEAIEKKYKS